MEVQSRACGTPRDGMPRGEARRDSATPSGPSARRDREASHAVHSHGICGLLLQQLRSHGTYGRQDHGEVHESLFLLDDTLDMSECCLVAELPVDHIAVA